jgi:hypothetical protein
VLFVKSDSRNLEYVGHLNSMIDDDCIGGSHKDEYVLDEVDRPFSLIVAPGTGRFDYFAALNARLADLESLHFFDCIRDGIVSSRCLKSFRSHVVRREPSILS